MRTRTHTFSSRKQDVKKVLKMNAHVRKNCMHKGTLYTHKYTIYTHKYLHYIQYIQLPAQGPQIQRILFRCALFCQPLIQGFAVSGTWAIGGTSMATMPKVLGFWLPTLAACIVCDPPYIFSFLHTTLLLKCPTAPVPPCEPGHRSSWSRNKWSWACTGC